MTDERDGNLGEVIDRRVQVYGDPVAGFAEIATMWSVLFDVEVPAWKVPIAQALMKVVRMKTSPDYSDHSDDIDGYLDIFRKIIGPDMIQARTVNEYIEKKWGEQAQREQVTQPFGWVGETEDVHTVLVIEDKLTCPACNATQILEIDVCERWNPASYDDGTVAVNLQQSEFQHTGWRCGSCFTDLEMPKHLDESVSYG